MIKFKLDGNNGPLVGVALSEDNIKELKKGRPIVINLADMGLPPGKVMIMYGRIEGDIAHELEDFTDLQYTKAPEE